MASAWCMEILWGTDGCGVGAINVFWLIGGGNEHVLIGRLMGRAW